ncbi:hypothetical protein CDV31_007270 [Fusarium ambrosium]|uniref:AB hydrolase-1 domain-containing protein n=1 Tax=Fusarium ambrosium TaxID=131363 RepID=A0A428U867_9HYPO|nr:hypothetical protein CDV31_007270 [Fusarium ambrosium]
MSSPEKPTIVLVHGAWHLPSHYTMLKEKLTERGFTVIQPKNASVGQVSEIKGKTHLDDVAAIHKAMESSLNDGKEIIVVCHSYGGIPGTAAVEGYQLHERREKGLKGGIKHIVYVASFALPAKGLSLKTAIGGTYGPFMERTDDYLPLNENAKNAFYHDIKSELADRMLADCVYQSTASFETPSEFVAPDITVPKTYVACENDQAIPIEGQLAMAGAMGDTVKIERLPSGHSPYLDPGFASRLVEIIDSIDA